MDAVEFLKNWKRLCNEQSECSNECPLHYDYCPVDDIRSDRDETYVSIVKYVEEHSK